MFVVVVGISFNDTHIWAIQPYRAWSQREFGEYLLRRKSFSRADWLACVGVSTFYEEILKEVVYG
jgi:hypothetical protein